MTSEIATLLDLLTRPEFLAGLVLGGIGLTILFLVPRGLRYWGLVFAVVLALGVNLAWDRRLAVTLGVALLAAGGAMLDRTVERRELHLLLSWGLVASGAILVTMRGGLSSDSWLELVAAMAIGGFGFLLGLWQETDVADLVGPLFFITAFGIWVTVPDTELARLVLGASIPLSLATIRPIEARLAHVGTFPLVGLVVWVVAEGGIERPASIVGGWASLGVLILVPLLTGRSGLANYRWTIVLAHGVFVLIASRVIGLWVDAGPALLAAAVLGVVAYLSLSYLTRSADAHPSRFG